MPDGSTFLEKYLEQYFSLKAVIISDLEGVHLFSAFGPNHKEQYQSLTRVSTMLIAAIKQTNLNLSKINYNDKISKINNYTKGFLIHIQQKDNLYVVLFMEECSSMVLANEISTDILKSFEKLNNMIPKLEKQ